MQKIKLKMKKSTMALSPQFKETGNETISESNSDSKSDSTIEKEKNKPQLESFAKKLKISFKCQLEKQLSQIYSPSITKPI